MKIVSKTYPSVGVVIPFYNGSKWIERALLSVFGQTIPAKEVIVVNDGSTKAERECLEYLSERYQSKFRIIDQENQGQGAARNAGVKHLDSEYICFLDQDDYFIDSHIEVLLNELPHNTNKLGFIYADLNVVDEQGRTLYFEFVGSRASHPKRSIEKLLSEDMYILPSASIINKNAFLSVGGFDSQFSGYEDDDLFLRIFIAGYENYFVPKAVTVWCINSASTTFSIRMKRSKYRYFNKLKNEFKDDASLGRFYFSNLVMRRFLWAFIADVVTEIKHPSEHVKEIKSFLIGYKNVVLSEKFVPTKFKIKLSIITFLLCYTPRPFGLALLAVYKLIK